MGHCAESDRPNHAPISTNGKMLFIINAMDHFRSFPVLLLALYLLDVTASWGQNQGLNDLRLRKARLPQNAIVVGKLVGHDDYRRTYLRISSGEYLITRNSNSHPFRVVSFSPDRLDISLQQHPLSDPTDPRWVIFRFFQNERQLMTSMILEEVDYAVLRTRSQAREVNRANPFMVVIPLKTAANTVHMVVYNLSHPVLKSAQVRRALSYAINKRKMVEELLVRDGIVARGSPYETDRPYYARGLDDYKYDPKKAIQILRTAGWRDLDRDGVLEKNGYELKIRLAFEKGMHLAERVARRIKLDLFEIGIEIIPVPYTKIEMTERLMRGDYQAALLEQQFEESIDSLYGFFADPQKGFVRFRNRNFDMLYRKAKKQLPGDRHRMVAHQLQAIINRYCLASFLFYRYYDYHLFNIKKVDNFYDERAAQVKPFDQWSIKQTYGRK